MSQQARDEMLKRARNIRESGRLGTTSRDTEDYLFKHEHDRGSGKPEQAEFSLEQPAGRDHITVTPDKTTNGFKHKLNDAEEAHVGRQVEKLESDVVN